MKTGKRMRTTYYQIVENYYDSDAPDFDLRYWKNPVLQRIRQDFREHVKRHEFGEMLEIGYGTGLDLEHFAATFPHARISGIDISGEMQKIASMRLIRQRLGNAMAYKGSVEDLQELFGEQTFDMVVVFFGALNTVEELKKAAQLIDRQTKPGGHLVLSFVNKYYLGGMLIELLKLRPRAAFSRLRRVWGGYSPSQFLPSRCYTPSAVQDAFADFRLVKRKGYSIVHPAWYYHRLNRILGRACGVLWRLDEWLNRSLLWRFGEYTLFVFQKPKR